MLGQERQTGGDFRIGRLPVTWRTPGQDVGDVNIFLAAQPDIAQHCVEQATAGADERQPFTVFVAAWRFAYEHHVGRGLSGAEDQVGGRILKRASVKLVQRISQRRQIGGRFRHFPGIGCNRILGSQRGWLRSLNRWRARGRWGRGRRRWGFFCCGLLRQGEPVYRCIGDRLISARVDLPLQSSDKGIPIGCGIVRRRHLLIVSEAIRYRDTALGLNLVSLRRWVRPSAQCMIVRISEQKLSVLCWGVADE